MKKCFMLLSAGLALALLATIAVGCGKKTEGPKKAEKTGTSQLPPLDTQRIAADEARGIKFSADKRTLTNAIGQDFEHYSIPEGVTTIGEQAFFACGDLKSITIPPSVTKIEELAFFGCMSLTNVVIPNGVTEIGKGAFSCCFKLTDVTIPPSVTKIGEGAFAQCPCEEQVKRNYPHLFKQ